MARVATTPYLSVEEYLDTVYRPDVDFVDDHIEERNLGEFDHGTLQAVITEMLRRHRKEWGIRVALDTRLRVAASRVRVPDVTVADAKGPKEQVLHAVPMLCIEVLSPKDTLRKMRSRAEDYFAMGVPVVWIFDPRKRDVTICLPGGAASKQQVGVLTLPGTPVSVDLAEAFSALDED